MRHVDFKRIHYVLCCILAFLIPFPFFLAPVVIILIAAAWLLAGNYQGFFSYFKRSPVLIGWAVFYALHVWSYFYSTDKAVAGFELEKKLSFVVLPIILYAPFYRHRRQVSVLLFSFIAGISLIALWCLARAVYLWMDDGDTGHFFYHALAQGTEANAVYVSWYVISALSLLFFMPWRESGLPITTPLRWSLSLLLTLFLILLSSRLLIALFLIILLPVLIWQSALRGRRRGPLLAGLGLLLVVAGGMAFTKNPVSQRFQEVFTKDLRQSYYSDYRSRDQQFTNLTLRVFLWRVGVDNLNAGGTQRWLLGTGTGDVLRYQKERMHELGIRDVYSKEYPSPYAGISLHNMYVQSLVMLGIAGFLLMCYLAFWPLGLRRRWPGRLPLLLIMGISAAFMFQESALQTQAGVVFYVFFSILLYNRYEAVKKAGGKRISS